jgi:hypothetical protein
MEVGGWKSERMVLRYAHVNTFVHTIAALPWEKSGEREEQPAIFQAKSSI